MPLSPDPDKRARQLANLKPRPVPSPYGARRHGGYSTVTAERLAPRTREIFDALALDAPLRDQGGELPAADAGIVTLLAQALCRLEDVTGYLEQTGWLDQKTGEPRTAVLEIERRLQAMAAGFMDRLGMTPTSRAKLGLDLTRTVDLATAMSCPDPVRRAELLRQAGVPDA
jgi:hypothetical protein